jgi:hypothetical protein
MAQVVLDNTNLEAIIKDATGEGFQIPGPSIAKKGANDEADKGAKSGVPEGVKDAPTAAEGNGEGAHAGSADNGADDIEGDDGLTPRQKRELTAKMQSAIGKKHRQAREAEEFATEQYNTRRLAEQRAEELARENARLKAETTPPPKEPTRPERQNFKTEDEFRDALIDFQVDQRIKAEKEKDAKAAAEKRQAEIEVTARARIAHALQIVPDYQEVTEAVDWPTPPAVANYMQESPLFAELGYYLCQHPEARELLDSLHWTRQLVEIGKIESKLQPFTAPVVKVKSDEASTSSTNGTTPSTETDLSPSPRSAPVIRPLSSSSATQVDKPAHLRTYEEEKALWQKKHSVNLSRRSRH